jgi:hypothetical protein
MKKSYFGLHFGGHLAYLAAFAAIIYFGKRTLAESEFLSDQLVRTQHFVPLDKIASLSISKIQKQADGYKNEVNENIRKKALRTQNLVFDFGEYSNSSQNSPNLLRKFTQLRDSLTIMYQNDTAKMSWIDRFFSLKNEENELILTSFYEKDKRNPIAHGLDFRAKLAAVELLESARTEILQDDNLVFDGMMPIILFSKQPKVGVPVEADVFGAVYSKTAKNIEIFINNEKIQIIDGVGHCEKIFNSVGYKKMNVRVEIRNPLTGQTVNYRKECGITVISE